MPCTGYSTGSAIKRGEYVKRKQPGARIDISSFRILPEVRPNLRYEDRELTMFARRWSHEVIAVVPGFKYWALGERRKMTQDDNICGHQQRAFDFYWQVRCCVQNGGIGLSVGATTVAGIACLGTDKYCGRPPENDKGRYGDSYGFAHMTMDADEAFPLHTDQFEAAFANHAIEHVRCARHTLSEMLRVVRPGGYVCIVMPDMAYMRRGDLDPTHTKEWAADEWLDWLENDNDISGRFAIHEHNTFDNRFSFNTVLEVQ